MSHPHRSIIRSTATSESDAVAGILLYSLFGALFAWSVPTSTVATRSSNKIARLLDGLGTAVPETEVGAVTSVVSAECGCTLAVVPLAEPGAEECYVWAPPAMEWSRLFCLRSVVGSFWDPGIWFGIPCASSAGCVEPSLLLWPTRLWKFTEGVPFGMARRKKAAVARAVKPFPLHASG